MYGVINKFTYTVKSGLRVHLKIRNAQDHKHIDWVTADELSLQLLLEWLV
jgi:hypothetical protein